MTDINSITTGFIELLERSPAVADNAKIITAFGKKTLPNPLRKLYIVVNPAAVTYTPGENGGEFNFSVNFHVSEQENPGQLFTRFSLVVTALENSPVYTLTGARCENLRRDGFTNSVFLPSNIKVRV